MLTNALRKELTEILAEWQADRQPALRRSRQAEWLYATDIIRLLGANDRNLLQDKLAAAGWEYSEEPGWLLLKKTADEPPANWFKGVYGPEAACCASLLKRHPGNPAYTDEAAQRALIKAGEEGEKAYEAACRDLHKKWAENLRRGESLPVFDSRYFEARKEI